MLKMRINQIGDACRTYRKYVPAKVRVYLNNRLSICSNVSEFGKIF
jgi:hypothetical protein